MIKIELEGTTYRVEFRHCTKVGKHHLLGKHSPVNAITTCVIACDDFIAIENAVCSAEDTFCRAWGRSLALSKAIDRSPLFELRRQFIAAYKNIKEAERKSAPEWKSSQLSAEEKARRIAAGESVRLARVARKYVAPMVRKIVE
jgi:hypothetical protein